MKKARLWFIVFYFLSIATVLLSSTTVDSLRIEITKVTGKEQKELKSHLAWVLSIEEPQEAILLCDSLLAQNYKDFDIDLLVSKANAYYHLEDYSAAFDIFDNVVTHYSSRSSLSNLAFSHLRLGYILDYQLEFQQAINHYLKSIEIYRSLEDFESIAHIENSIGIVYETMSVWDKALEHYIQAFVLYEKAGDLSGVATTYNNMGNIYQTLMNQTKALEFYQKSGDLYEELNDKDGLSVIYNNMGIIYDELKDYDKALDYYEKSLDLDQEINDHAGIATGLNNIGVIYTKTGQYELAEKNLIKVIEINSSLNDIWSEVNAQINLSEVYALTDKFAASDSLLKNALITAENYNFVDLIIDGYLKYSIYYLNLSDYENAYKYYERYSSLKDSLYSSFSVKIGEIQTVFEAEEKSRELEMLYLKNKHSSIIRIFLIVASVVLLILSTLMFYLYTVRNREVKYRKRIEAEQKKLAEIVNQAQESIMMTDKNSNIVYVNKHFEELTGYSFEEVKGRNPNLLQSGITDKEVYKGLWNTIKAGKDWFGTFVNRRKNGEIYYEQVTIFPIKDKDGEIINYASVKRDITDEIESSKNLEESEKRFRNMADNINDGLTIIENGKVVYTNKRLSEITGYSQEELRFITGLKLAAPFEIERVKVLQENTNCNNIIPDSLEYWIHTKNGELRHIRNDYSYDQEAENHNRYIITSDMTEKKIAQERLINSLHEKEVMLKEIHHRVKNNMQVISSLLKLQSSYIKDEESLQLFKNSQSRVKTMALVHEKLYRSENLSEIDLKDYIKNLSRHIMATYTTIEQRITIDYDIGDIFLDINSAVPFGLILNELISNAFKYAFPDNRDGKIFIGFNLVDNDRYCFTVKDNGIGLPDDFDISTANTLGMQLVNSLTMQLHGDLEIENKDGTSFSISFEKKKDKKDKVLYPKGLKHIIGDE